MTKRCCGVARCKVIEETDTALPRVGDLDATEFDLSHDSVILNVIVGKTEQPANNSLSELDPMVNKTGDNQTGNEFDAGISLDELTHYPGIQRSEQWTEGISPGWLGQKNGANGDRADQ